MPGVGGLGGRGGSGGGAAGGGQREPVTVYMKREFGITGFSERVTVGMYDEFIDLARKRSENGILKDKYMKQIKAKVMNDPKYKKNLWDYLYYKLSLPTTKFLFKLYISNGKDVSDDEAIKQEWQWRMEASPDPSYHGKFNELVNTREEIKWSLFKYVTLKYDQADLKWFTTTFKDPDPETEMLNMKARYMHHCMRFNFRDLLGRKRVDFRSYAQNKRNKNIP